MKHILLFLITMLVFLSCTDDCCYTGNKVELDGNLKCLNGENVAGVTVTARNSSGDEFVITTDENGSFNFPSMPVGEYTLTFQNDNLYEYDTMELINLFQTLILLLQGIQLPEIWGLLFSLIGFLWEV